MDYIVYLSAADAKIGKTSIIKIPLWKCSHVCYLDILQVIYDIELADYPFEYGPYPSPYSWVSYMESTFQFSFNFIIFEFLSFIYILYLIYIDFI